MSTSELQSTLNAAASILQERAAVSDEGAAKALEESIGEMKHLLGGLSARGTLSPTAMISQPLTPSGTSNPGAPTSIPDTRI